jgi:glycosyltransferase involved in cell wall biosynthesis
MKILATGMEWFEQIPGGLNQYFADYLKSMIQTGHSVEGLLSGEGDKLKAPDYIRDVVAEAARLDTYRRMKSFSRAVEDRIWKFHPDVYNPHFALYASLVTRNIVPRHIPIVTHFHGPWAHESQVEEQGNPVKKFVRYQMKKKIEQAIYRRSDSFIVLSRYFQNLLSSDFGVPLERIHVIPGAVDTERFRPAADRESLRNEMGLNGNEKVLFCARRLVRRMGIENLIRAMGHVVRNVPEAVLYIAGDGPLKDEFRKLLVELDLNASVRLLGRVSNEDLVRWYQAADLSIVPTVTLEGFGLVTTEALACGTPVLGTPNGGTKEILEKLSPESLFHDNSEVAMASKIISVLQGDCPVPTREECRQYVVRNYSWSNVAQSITQVFENAVVARKERWRYEGSLL